MENPPSVKIVDTLVLRFMGESEDGIELHELRASHVAEVLRGLVGISSDFEKAGVFHDDGPSSSEILVRPPQQGSFLLEVVRVITENPEATAKVVAATGAPTLSTIIWWATKSVRAGVKDFSHLDNGNVKIVWQDDTADEVPRHAWEELQKRKRRRKKQLREIMAPLSDPRVEEVELSAPEEASKPDDNTVDTFTLERDDYEAAKPNDEIEEDVEFLDVEAGMSAIDFDDPTKWKVRTRDEKRTATVEDEEFLGRVAGGLPIRKSDIFRLHIRQDSVRKNGRTRTKWTVLAVKSHKRGVESGNS